MTAREWLQDDDVRGRVETIALCSSMVGLGAGIGIMWSYAAVTQTAALPPAPWIGDLTTQLRGMISIAGGVFAASTAVMFALIFTDPDADDQEVRADGGVVEPGSPGSNHGDRGGETTLRDRLRGR